MITSPRVRPRDHTDTDDSTIQFTENRFNFLKLLYLTFDIKVFPNRSLLVQGLDHETTLIQMITPAVLIVSQPKTAMIFLNIVFFF